MEEDEDIWKVSLSCLCSVHVYAKFYDITSYNNWGFVRDAHIA